MCVLLVELRGMMVAQEDVVSPAPVVAGRPLDIGGSVAKATRFHIAISFVL